MKRPVFLFVESNTSGTGPIFLERAFAMGYHPVLLCRDPARYPFLHNLSAESVTLRAVDTQDLQALVREALRLQAGPGVAGVFSSSEYAIPAASALARALDLPGGDPNAIRNCRSKAWQRSQLEPTGLNPLHTVADSVAAAARAAARIGLPVVVKPVSGTGSIGVRLCRSLDEVRSQAGLLLTGAAGEILVEQAVQGPEFSVEVMSGAVIGVTGKHLGPLPYFVEIGHDFPADLSAKDASALSEAAQTAVRALGLTWGPVHVELRLTPSGPRIMEVNPRLAGDMIPELIRYATGVDLIGETIRLAAGGEPDITPTRAHHAGIRFLLPDRPGVFAGVTGLAQHDGLVQWRVYPSAGMPVMQQGDFRDRVGHVICVGRSARELAERLDQVLAAARVELA